MSSADFGYYLFFMSLWLLMTMIFYSEILEIKKKLKMEGGFIRVKFEEEKRETEKDGLS